MPHSVLGQMSSVQVHTCSPILFPVGPGNRTEALSGAEHAGGGLGLLPRWRHGPCGRGGGVAVECVTPPTASAAEAPQEGGKGSSSSPPPHAQYGARGAGGKGVREAGEQASDTITQHHLQGAGAVREHHPSAHGRTPSSPAVPAPRCFASQVSGFVLFADFLLCLKKHRGDGFEELPGKKRECVE